MAYVLQFAPEGFTAIPRHGTIQFHPSLLPRYRGPSSINWPIIRGDTRTGLTIFRPTDGLDEGPILLQKETPIGPDDTLGTVYFERLYPAGIAALLEAADLVVSGRATGTVQDESQASYEGWCKRGRSAHQLAQPRGYGLQPHPRLQSGAGRVDAVQRQEVAAVRGAQTPGAHLFAGQGPHRRSQRRSAIRACS